MSSPEESNAFVSNPEYEKSVPLMSNCKVEFGKVNTELLQNS